MRLRVDGMLGGFLTADITGMYVTGAAFALVALAYLRITRR